VPLSTTAEEERLTHDAAEDAPRSYAADTWRRFRRNPSALIGGVVVGAMLLVALLAPLLARADPLAQDLAHQGLAPSLTHLMGTDKLGRDIFARIVYGARVSVRIGFIAVSLAIVAGTLIGATAGFVGGTVDNVLMSAMDVMLAFPSIILAIAIATILGPSINNLMIAVGIVYIPQYARLARSSVLVVRELEYVEAARAIGEGPTMILARHILPNIAAPLLVQATLGVATAELEAAGLSYLGLGARPPAPEWGAMLNDARDYWLSAPWALIFPGVAITTLVLGFNLLGEGLRDALDPTDR
jgi:peptide/nickel transport system permease protein